MIHFVGAGPGAPDLITLRGMRYLEQADVVIYAGSLVNPTLLDMCREGVRIYDSAYMNLGEINEAIWEAHENGLDVVRLQTGDMSLYSAIAEQIEFLRVKGIDYDITPGVSSVFGAASAIGRELTLPGVSQTLIISRIEGRTAVPKSESIESLASHGATMALFLSAGKAKELQERLIKGGYTPDTPAAVVYKATWEDERIITCRLGELADRMDESNISKTSIIFVGNVIGQNSYEYSKLYAEDFTTEYRKGK